MIRQATVDDASRIAEINVYGWRYAYRGIVDDKYLFGKMSVEESTIRHRKTLGEGNRNFFVFEEDEIIKGMSMIMDCRDKDNPGAFELVMLYVEKAFSRQGVGTELLRHFEETARERSKYEAVIWVLEENVIGRSFYDKHGYRPDGASKFIERINSKEIRVVKNLTMEL